MTPYDPASGPRVQCAPWTPEERKARNAEFLRIFNGKPRQDEAGATESEPTKREPKASDKA